VKKKCVCVWGGEQREEGRGENEEERKGEEREREGVFEMGLEG
jgi:hypothetical protein